MPMTIPSFGVGTFRLTGQTVIDSVHNALDVGYRAVDTAQIYGNEAEVGLAIAESGVPRADLFVTTKIWTDNYAKDKLIPSLRESLEKLRTDYVDLTLIHWPAPGNGVSLPEFMEALAEAKAQGLTRQIGVSNFNIALTQQAIDVVGKGQIATNQIELSPYLQNHDIGLRQSAERPCARKNCQQTPCHGCKTRIGVGLTTRLCRDSILYQT